VVVPAAGATLEEKALLDALKAKLAKYKVPKSVVVAEALPRNPSGKLLRPQIRERWGKP